MMRIALFLSKWVFRGSLKLYCDYCGSQIDTDKDITCSRCDAAYAKDAELKAGLKREENRLL